MQYFHSYLITFILFRMGWVKSSCEFPAGFAVSAIRRIGCALLLFAKGTTNTEPTIFDP